jgi:hypothetical protein
VPVGQGSLFSSPKDEPAFRDVRDGTFCTLMVVEVDDQHAVIWTKPDDLPFDSTDPKKGVGGMFAAGFNTVLCDGAVRAIPALIEPKNLKALMTRAAGDGPDEVP